MQRLQNRVIDSSVFDELRSLERGGAAELVARVVDAYLGSAPNLIGVLRKSFDEDDPESMRRSAHALKSSSGNVGALEFSDICRQLEELGRDGTVKDAETLVNALEANYDRVRAALLVEKQAQ